MSEPITYVGIDAHKVVDYFERNPDQRWEKRLGEAPAPPNTPPYFFSANATELARRAIGHSDHIDSPEIASRVLQELRSSG